MKPQPLALFLGACLTLLPTAHAQVPPEKAESTFTVADGLEMRLWASEPLFVNPTCMDIDHRGRVWVCESVNYRHKLHRRPPARPAGDRIVILEDSKGTGRADKATTFYQSPDTLAPLGIAVAKDPVGPGYKVFVCQSPDILVFEDKDGDGHADGPPKKLLSGFGGFDSDHGVHGILIGPDMKLYFSVGDTGVHGLQSSDGKGRRWTSNETDCRAGTIWRCDLDGRNLELIAHNFRNEYEPCVDSFGTVFVSDNDDDGNQQTRICYVMPGGDYGYHPRGPGQSHWHEEQPGVVPKILRTYFGSPTGMCVYEGTLLPKKYQGQLLHTDAGPRHVRCYHLTPQGAGYAVEREDMVTSTDTWFRPSDICVAPDGSAYVADWYDPGVGGHAMGDITHGRIFRLAPKGNRPSVPTLDLETKDGMFAALASPNLAVRYMAMAKFMKDPPLSATLMLTDAIKQQQNPWLRARALWLIGRISSNQKSNKGDPPAPRSSTSEQPFCTYRGLFLKEDSLSHVREPETQHLAVVRYLKDCFGESAADYSAGEREYLLHDTAAVRREALLGLRDVDPGKAKSLVLKLAQEYDGKDRFYLEAIGIAVGHHDKKRRDIILADFDKQFPQWNDKVADLIWELRPPQVLPRLEKQLADASLPSAQRSRMVDVLAAAPDSSAGKSMLKVLQSPVAADVRDRIVENLSQFLPGKWRALRSSPELTQTIDSLLGQAGTRAAGLVLVAAAQKRDAIPRVRDLAADDKQALQTRRVAVQTLGKIPSKDSVAALETFLVAKGNPLAADAVEALGLQIPMWQEWPGTRAALKRLETLVVAKDTDPAVKQTAAATLAGTQQGTAWLLDAHQRNALPADLVADVGRLVRNSPFEDLRSRALKQFPPPMRIDPKKLPSIATLAQRRGDLARGKQLIAASLKSDLQCLKCHTIRGVGGHIGPDLSVIGTKASRENLYESILVPSKAIADQYVTWVVETRQGMTVSGLLIEETAKQLTLRDANGKDTKIDKEEIESRSKSLVSLMPADLVAYLTEEDLVDVVEYLFSLKEERK
jgi:putative membrane-bound dehydrogenase-like protein